MIEKFKVESCLDGYAVKDNKGEFVLACNSKQNADLIAAILKKDNLCENVWFDAEKDYYVFDADDFYKVKSQYYTRNIYSVKEARLGDGSLCRDIMPGMIVRHFKGNLYEIKDIVHHSETGDMMVVYQALYPNKDGQRQTCVRPLSMFMSEVDRQKYPHVEQKYRFEVVQFNDALEGE